MSHSRHAKRCASVSAARPCWSVVDPAAEDNHGRSRTGFADARLPFVVRPSYFPQPGPNVARPHSLCSAAASARPPYQTSPLRPLGRALSPRAPQVRTAIDTGTWKLTAHTLADLHIDCGAGVSVQMCKYPVFSANRPRPSLSWDIYYLLSTIYYLLSTICNLQGRRRPRPPGRRPAQFATGESEACEAAYRALRSSRRRRGGGGPRGDCRQGRARSPSSPGTHTCRGGGSPPGCASPP